MEAVQDGSKRAGKVMTARGPVRRVLARPHWYVAAMLRCAVPLLDAWAEAELYALHRWAHAVMLASNAPLC